MQRTSFLLILTFNIVVDKLLRISSESKEQMIIIHSNDMINQSLENGHTSWTERIYFLSRLETGVMISFFTEWLLGTLEVDLKPMAMADKDTNSIVPLLNRIRSDWSLGYIETHTRTHKWRALGTCCNLFDCRALNFWTTTATTLNVNTVTTVFQSCSICFFSEADMRHYMVNYSIVWCSIV